MQQTEPTKVLHPEAKFTVDDRRILYAGVVFAVLAVVLRLFFWAYTHRTWEDALIAVLHSENAAQGLGLTHAHSDGRPVQGFSSPLGVLIPLLADTIHPGWGLGLLKAVSALAAGATVWFAALLLTRRNDALGLPFAIMVMAYLALDHSQILYGMAGMETQLVTMILLASFYCAVTHRWVWLGLSLGLCMLARPDYAFWTVIAGIYVLVTAREKFLVVAGTALLLYSPWFLFAWAYYGNPIPNTILAKGSAFPLWWQDPEMSFARGVPLLWSRVNGSFAPNSVFQPLAPGFPGHGMGFLPVMRGLGWVSVAMTLAAMLGAAISLRRVEHAGLLAAAFFAVYALYFLFLTPVVHGWYLVPFCAVALLLSSRGLSAVAHAMPNLTARRILSWTAPLAYVVLLAGVLPRTIEAERRIQSDIEEPVRRQIGRYLAEISSPGETIGCEPLGYISYGARREIYDWPGLANREVVAFVKTHPDDATPNGMFKHFMPDYLVLREQGRWLVEVRGGWVFENYAILRHFQASLTDTWDILHVHANIDRSFYVLKRKALGVDAPFTEKNPVRVPPVEVEPAPNGY